MRLTKNRKDRLVRDMLSNLYDKESTKLKVEREKIAEKVYNILYSKKERDLMYALPDGFLPLTISVSYSKCGERIYFNFRESKRIPANFNGTRNLYYPEKAIKIMEPAVEEEILLRKRRKQIKSFLERTINTINTSEQLFSLLPESKKFFETCEIENEKCLPASTRDLKKINEMLSKITVDYTKGIQ